MKEFNRDTVGFGPIKSVPTIGVRKSGALEISKAAAALLDIPHLGVKFYEDDGEMYIAPSDDNNAFRMQSKAATGAMMQSSALARHILDKCGENIFSATLEISDKPVDGKYKINLVPLRFKKGAPA